MPSTDPGDPALVRMPPQGRGADAAAAALPRRRGARSLLVFDMSKATPIRAHRALSSGVSSAVINGHRDIGPVFTTNSRLSDESNISNELDKASTVGQQKADILAGRRILLNNYLAEHRRISVQSGGGSLPALSPVSQHSDDA
ncbi:hypothetical protein EVAR_46851_1 [Eumeta japonica]|uniref:Uncharacterized protein n=1 Tax=Eumeta variegata TaxID=151549 RepID=A0A4C1XS94_EUMVA|nr:hypothetical protein EVAR_46851_1 [Eumeta japonica]